MLSFEQGTTVSADPRAVVPERALVFELIGPVPEFDVAAQALGLDWLRFEAAEESGVGEDVDSEDGDPSAEGAASAGGFLYLTMPSLQGLRRLLALWSEYKKGADAPNPRMRPLWNMFGYLKALRGWSVQDRIDPSIRQYVDALLAAEDRPVRVEIDLWYRTEAEKRARSVNTLLKMLKEVGGELLDLVDIPEIKYQGVLVRVPSSVARRLVQDRENPDSAGRSIATLDDVMTIRPQSSYASRLVADTSYAHPLPNAPAPVRPPIAAVIDGYPVEQHAALAGRLVIEEVDVTGDRVPVRFRGHGTAMSSLVLHGDLQQYESTIDRQLVMIPVLEADPTTGLESTPVGKLPIGVIYRAIRRLVDAPTGRPDLRSIVIVNHSICDEHAPFVRRQSPWAALLDYYSHHHRLLFVVSAGNIFSAIPVPDFEDVEAFEAASTDARQAALLNAVEAAKGTRGLLSPAEAMNVLSVGALHGDGAVVDSSLDPFPSVKPVNLASAIGLGLNRSVKPDVVEVGGRFMAGCANLVGGGVQVHPRQHPELGQLVAMPSPTGDLRRVIRAAGTSNATALVSRSCHQIADAVEDVFAADGIDWLGLPTRAVILKTLLAHSCAWGSIGDVLEDAYPPSGNAHRSKRRDTITRFLGYGRPQAERVVSGANNRVTLLASDTIQHGSLHEYAIPLTRSIVSNRDIRRVFVTLSWTCPSPSLATSVDYRGVVLQVCNPEGKSGLWKGVDRVKIQPNGPTSRRGTLVHFAFEGRKLIPSEGHFPVCVQATARHPQLETVPVPYALAVTVELAQSARANLYAEVRDAVRARAATRVSVR